MLRRFAVSLAATSFLAAAAFAVPATTAFTYQGELRSGGQPVSGVYDFEFRLADAANIGLQLGLVQVADVQVTDGTFTVQLDFGAQFTGEARWLDVRVRDGASAGPYTVLTPRQPLTAAPYAAGLVMPFAASASAPTSLLTLTNTGSTGSVIRAVSSGPSGSFPAAFFQPVISADTDDGNGIFALTSANGAFALYAVQSGAGGRAVVARNEGTSGRAGTFDIADPGNASNALESTTLGPGRAGLFTINNTASSANALRATTNGTGSGVAGNATGTGGIGVEGTASGAGSLGVKGTGLSAGVRGEAGTTNGAGVIGVSTASGNGGGVGVPAGVRGEASAGGVAGGAFFNNVGTALYAQSTSGTAGFFSGNVAITGSLSKGSGSFKIDHPLDPSNKYLYHSFVESPDMKNIYDGVAVLDAQGRAVVTMPDYFSALNADFRYQLTCIGAHAPVYIAKELDANRFEIAGGQPGMKVSWQVTGTRIDALARDQRIQVEVDKPAHERGRYLYPQGFGQPADKGLLFGSTPAH